VDPVAIRGGEWGRLRHEYIRGVHVHEGKGGFWGFSSPFISMAYLLNTSTRLTGGPILTIDPYDVFPCKDVLFGGSVNTSPI